MSGLEGQALSKGDGAGGCGVGFPLVQAGAPFVELLLGSQAELDGCSYDLGGEEPAFSDAVEESDVLGGVVEVILEGEVGHVADVEGCVGVAACLGGGSGEGDLGLLHVDAVHLSGVDCVCETY